MFRLFIFSVLFFPGCTDSVGETAGDQSEPEGIMLSGSEEEPLNLIDANGDGRVSLNEFLDANPSRSKDGAILIFKRFDSDHDGFLTATQFPIQTHKDSHAIQK